jgi:hypothetical protein
MIDAKIAALGDWRGEILAQVRQWILEAAPRVVEEIKWRKPTNPAGVPVWSRSGVICTGEVYKDKVKLTFATGAALPDPCGLFSAGLDGGTRRAIDLRQGRSLDRQAFVALIRAAVEHNLATSKPPKGPASEAGAS